MEWVGRWVGGWVGGWVMGGRLTDDGWVADG